MALLQGTRGLRLSVHIKCSHHFSASYPKHFRFNAMNITPCTQIQRSPIVTPNLYHKCCSSYATEARVSHWNVEERYLKCCLAVKEQQPLRVAVLISGGVDSSVALRLLCAAGHSCTAFYLKIWFQDDFENFWSACPWDEDLTYAKAVCDEVGVDLQIVHLTDEYWNNVVSYVISEYRSGRTPNPDVLCNTRIKFGAFMDFINKMDFDYVASGHYAHVEHQSGDSETKMSVLHLSADKIKDQTYFLCHLSQAQLQRLLFPLGCLTKEEVRKLAAEMGLPNKERKDSQGICFLGKVKFSEFVSKHIGEMEGILLEAETGDFLGKHRGFWFYTIGQRQGIRLPGGPWYVVKKDIENNVVFVSRNYYSLDKQRRIFCVGSLNWILGATPDSFDKLQCKVRHGPKLYECDIELVKGNLSKRNDTTQDVAVVRLAEDDQGIAVGQFAAFYQESICLGSGIIIDSCEDHDFVVCTRALEIARLKDKSELKEPVKIKNYDNSFASKSNIVKISNPVDEATSQMSRESVTESRCRRQIWVNLTNTVTFVASWFKFLRKR